MRPGTMYQNGHAQCGGCSALLDRCAGGRRTRKADGWSYTGQTRLGWVCGVCAPWAVQRHATRRDTAQRAPDVDKSFPIVDNSRGAVRGFGAEKFAVSFSRQLRNRRRTVASSTRRRAARAENRAAGRPSDVPDLDRLSPREYLQYIQKKKPRTE